MCHREEGETALLEPLVLLWDGHFEEDPRHMQVLVQNAVGHLELRV